jgi:hypothetical protein
LAAIGRLTLLFSGIEDQLVHDALELAQISRESESQQVSDSALRQLRILEKRDFLKRVIAEIGGFYEVDCRRVHQILDKLGNINSLRRSVVHGWIRWSPADKKPVLIDSHGRALPAWPHDVLGLNIQVLNWRETYSKSQEALMREILRAYNRFADRLLQRPGLPPALIPLMARLKTELEEGSG